MTLPYVDTGQGHDLELGEFGARGLGDWEEVTELDDLSVDEAAALFGDAFCRSVQTIIQHHCTF